MENVDGHVKFQNHYGNVHVHLSGNCKTWRSDIVSEDGGWLSADVFVDIIEQKWHSNLKITNLFVPVCYIRNNYLYLTVEIWKSPSKLYEIFTYHGFPFHLHAAF